MEQESFGVKRRRFLAGVGSGVVAGLAGCLDGGGDPAGTEYVPNEPNYKGWFDGVSNYKRTVEKRGESDVTLEVGVQGDLGYYKFGPPAVAVSPDTTITWEWTGKGGTHNVVSLNDLFDSGAPVDGAGHTFTHSFDAPGIYYYLCEPHESLGMKGAIFVALDTE